MYYQHRGKKQNYPTSATEDEGSSKNIGKIYRKKKCLRTLKMRTKKQTETIQASKENQPHRKEYKQVVREILKQGKRLSLHEETYYLAICYYEVFICTDSRSYLLKSVQKTISNIKLLATVMLLISSKLNDIYPPSIDKLSFLFEHVEKQNLINAEKDVLEKIDFQYIAESPYVLFYSEFKDEAQNIKRCCERFERSVLQDWSMTYGSEILSKAVMHSTKQIDFIQENAGTKIQIKDLSSKIKKLVNM